jgi:hypothetical protein
MHLTENLRELFGVNFKGMIIISTAAVAESFLENIESVRAWIEIVVGAAIGDLGDVVGNTMRVTGEIENKILDYAPPRLPGAAQNDSREWINHLIEMVDAAQRFVHAEDVNVPPSPDLPPLEW